MAAALFYHLTRSTLEDAVAAILRRALDQGWRVVVRGSDRARMEWLDRALWLVGEESFLPHGLAGGPHDARQPVLLTCGDELPADAALMVIEGAELRPEDCAGRARVWILFDGAEAAAVERAREQWKALTAAGVPAQYWTEDSGRWQKKTESAGASSP
ncbi:MAG: DNA polymerase III subunit chi [Rhodobacteraceae bacterium]|nr:DNA polymerase III subunit chi [Paracoccaceae bacterium]